MSIEESKAYKNLYLKNWYIIIVSTYSIIPRDDEIEKILKLTEKEKNKIHKARNPFEELEIPELEELEIPELEED